VAFTDAQRVKLRLYLGYPNINRHRDSRLESALDIVGDDAAAKAEVESIMASIVAVDTSLVASLGTAGLKRAEDIEWYQAGSSSTVGPEISSKWSEGRRHISRLSILFGVPIWGDYYGGRGYPGDAFMGIGHQYGGPLKLG
jgi:hypothetical protein